jgi:histidinol phosphatase-like PHP family hydrolase
MSDGRFTFDPVYRSGLAVLIGSVHYLPFQDDLSKVAFFDAWRRNTSALINGGIDVLGHPFRFIANYISVTEDIVKDVVGEAVECGVALELNSHYEVDADVLMLREIAERGAKISLGTDSHRRDEIGLFDYHDSVLKKAGVSLSDLTVFTPGI